MQPFRPSLVSWNLTKRCNLRCPHCYVEAGKAAAHELSTEECLAVLGELRALGTEMVILTGGEPLLRRDIYEIASAASAAGLWVVMGTNGVLVTDAVAARMIECGVRGVAARARRLTRARTRRAAADDGDGGELRRAGAAARPRAAARRLVVQPLL